MSWCLSIIDLGQKYPWTEVSVDRSIRGLCTMTLFHLYKIQIAQLLLEKDKTASVPFCRRFMSICDADAGVLYRLVMYDEAKFHLSG